MEAKQFLLKLETRSAFFCDEKFSEVMGSILVEVGRNTQPPGPLTSAVGVISDWWFFSSEKILWMLGIKPGAGGSGSSFANHRAMLLHCPISISASFNLSDKMFVLLTDNNQLLRDLRQVETSEAPRFESEDIWLIHFVSFQTKKICGCWWDGTFVHVHNLSLSLSHSLSLYLSVSHSLSHLLSLSHSFLRHRRANMTRHENKTEMN